MRSIKQNAAAHPLPDCRNLGIVLRVLVGGNVLALLGALAKSPDLGAWLPAYVDAAAWVEPLLLVDVAILAMARDALRRLSPAIAQAAVVVLVMVSAAVLQHLLAFLEIGDDGWQQLARAVVLAGGVAVVLLAYFALRATRFSPALAEARLQALTARMRPHFFFNCLNAVLSLIRSDPKRAELALEELAEMFRALMRDHGELVLLSEEIALCRQYLDLEKLRLGDRLAVDWKLVDLPADVRVPPLLLQPLVENAVYHGIEPADSGGEIHIRLARVGKELEIELTNPARIDGGHHVGNRMALANLRERLSLHYDLEARLEAGEVDGLYRVRIVLPCRN